MIKNIHNHAVWLAHTAAAITIISVVACSAGSSEMPKNTTSTANTQPIQTPQASASILPSASPSATPKPSCWEQILKSPESLACTTMFIYSTKTCIAGVVKQTTCTRDSINAAYANATLNGQPVMPQVDQWIADGYKPDQCAIGSDNKLNVYFVKQNFVPKEQGNDNMNHYNLLEKSLGSAGVIRLEANSPNSSTTCE